MPIEEQTVVIYAATKGFLDKVRGWAGADCWLLLLVQCCWSADVQRGVCATARMHAAC
jgi:hypothetical protein